MVIELTEMGDCTIATDGEQLDEPTSLPARFCRQAAQLRAGCDRPLHGFQQKNLLRLRGIHLCLAPVNSKTRPESIWCSSDRIVGMDKLASLKTPKPPLEI